MKLKLFRGTKLSEAIKLLEHKQLKKKTFWITDKKESLWYAETSKREDKYIKWSIIEADFSCNKDEFIEISEQDIDILYDKKNILLKNKIGIYKTSKFDIVSIPHSFQKNLNNIKINEIV